MNRNEVIALMDIISDNYPNYFQRDKLNGTINTWLSELCQYDKDEVMERLKELLADSKFQMKPPTLYHITLGLTPLHERVDFTKGTFYCPRCNRPFNYEPEMKTHWDRCRSVDYIIRETKKWFKKDIKRRQLFDMSDEEFNATYDRLLHYIYEHTTDTSEKTRIGYIFNPPSMEEAQCFLRKPQIQ